MKQISPPTAAALGKLNNAQSRAPAHCTAQSSETRRRRGHRVAVGSKVGCTAGGGVFAAHRAEEIGVTAVAWDIDGGGRGQGRGRRGREGGEGREIYIVAVAIGGLSTLLGMD